MPFGTERPVSQVGVLVLGHWRLLDQAADQDFDEKDDHEGQRDCCERHVDVLVVNGGHADLVKEQSPEGHHGEND